MKTETLSQIPQAAEAEQSAAMRSNLELLSNSGEIGRYLIPFYEAAVAAEPRLSEVRVRPMQDADASEGNVGFAEPGCDTATGEDEVTVHFGDDWGFYANLLKTRPRTVEVTADKLGLQTNEADEQLMAVFVFLHELGHVVDWTRNTDGDKQSIYERREKDMQSLPVPGISPGRLGELVVSKRKDYKKMFRQHKAYFDSLSITNLSEMVEAQEIAYRYIETEKIPDEFAVNILTSNSRT